jgi:hypothetical protein
MATRHNRNLFYLANSGTMCGAVDRPATPAEEQRAFRFSRIVESGSPAPSDALLEALADGMTRQAPTPTARSRRDSPISASSSTTT